MTPDDLLILNLSLQFQREAPPLTTLSQAKQLFSLAVLIEWSLGIDPLAAAAGTLLDCVSIGADFYTFEIEVAFLSLLYPDNVLVVGAAGNDGPDSLGLPQDELAPARYGIDFEPMLAVMGSQLPFPVQCAFLGVAAVSGDQTVTPARASIYTNRGEIAILGGDVLPPYPNPNFALTQYANFPGGLPDTVVGIGTNPVHVSGWYNWAGTSFAAAIVSGIAAAVATRSVFPLKAKNLRALVTSFADPLPIASLGCKAIIVDQIRL